jgi:hypothetical protein
MSRRRKWIVAAPVATVFVFVFGMLVGPGGGTAAYAVGGTINVTVQAASNLEILQTETFTVDTNISGTQVDDNETFPVFLTGASRVQVGTLEEDDRTDLFVGTFDPTGAVCGTNTVQVLDVLNGETVNQGTTTFVEQCPQITLNPATVAQADEPTTVQVTGTQFTPAVEAGITLNGTQAADPEINDTGGFTTPITVSGLPCGTYPVTATMVLQTIQSHLQSPGAPAVLTADITPLGGAGPSAVGLFTAGPTSTATTATAPLTVTCPAAPPPPPPPAGAVTLKANPDVVAIGSVTSVTGTGYTPNAPVTLTWQLAGGVTVPAATAPVTADGSGNITDPLVVLLPAAPGQCNLVATQGTATASAPVVVQDGSMEPSTGDSGGGDQLIFRE